ncbi:13034_t:CDS:2 [Funneliformis geosporum]|nr:13034_t:CDS:2 [Funneliformis geosporum]
MTRGYSLEQDLRFLLNNQKYSDIEIVCKDEKKLHGCRVILAARSEVFNRLLYSGLGEKESLTKDNIVKAFIAAEYFQLPDLQDTILKIVKIILEKNRNDNYSPELLSKILDTMSLSENNILSNLLLDAVSAIPLNTIEFGRLSTTALSVLLSYTYGKDIPFVTPEYEVFRYSVIIIARNISNDSTKSILKRLPTLENIDNFKRTDNEIIPDHHNPLNIIPVETILNVYRHRAMSYNTELNEVRRHLLASNKTGFVWNNSACGSNLVIEDNGKVVRASNACRIHQSVKGSVHQKILIMKNLQDPNIPDGSIEFNFNDGISTGSLGPMPNKQKQSVQIGPFGKYNKFRL